MRPLQAFGAVLMMIHWIVTFSNAHVLADHGEDEDPILGWSTHSVGSSALI